MSADTTLMKDNMTLFHGTDSAAALLIFSTGRLNGPVFLTPRYDAAKAYGGADSVVIALDVHPHELRVDFDLPGARLLTIPDANAYSDHEGWTIDDYVDSGASVGIPNTILLAHRQVRIV